MRASSQLFRNGNIYNKMLSFVCHSKPVWEMNEKNEMLLETLLQALLQTQPEWPLLYYTDLINAVLTGVAARKDIATHLPWKDW